MTAWLTTLVALWTFPIIGYLIIRLTRNRLDIRKKILWFSLAANFFAAFGLLTNVSTTLVELDWIIVSSFYLTTCTLLWLAFELQNKIIKVVSVFAMVCIFGIGYFSGTVGALGVGFVTAEYEPRVERWLGDGIIYKETILGNAISDYRGKRVEVFKTIQWLPIIEWRIQKKEYFNLITYRNELSVNYKSNEEKIFLATSMNWGKDGHIENWADTLMLDK